MSVIFVGNVSAPIMQPQSPVRQAADGSGEAHISYACPWNQVQGYVPQPLQPHPIFSGLLLYEFEMDREPGGMGVYSLIYRGIFSNNPQLLAQEECNVTTTSEPIETNPIFAFPPSKPPVTSKQIAAIDKAIALFVEPNKTDVPDGSKARLLYEKKIRGIDSWLRVGTNYRVSYCQTAVPSDYSTVGRIVSSLQYGQNMPSPPQGQNYLKTALSWKRAGGVVYVSEEATMSGRSGWDADLYGSGTGGSSGGTSQGLADIGNGSDSGFGGNSSDNLAGIGNGDSGFTE